MDCAGIMGSTVGIGVTLHVRGWRSDDSEGGSHQEEKTSLLRATAGAGAEAPGKQVQESTISGLQALECLQSVSVPLF